MSARAPRRVVITGVGLVSSFGSDPAAYWQALVSGTSGVTRTPVEGVEGPGVIGAPATGFNPRDHIDGKSLRLMAPAVAFGVAGAQMAMTDSTFKPESMAPERFGVFMGSRGHSSDRQDLMAAVKRASQDGAFSLATFGTAGLPLVHPMWLLKGLANNVLYFVSLKYNAQGMNNNISMGGVGGTMAIGEAFQAVQRGYLDAALAGGYDSGLDLDRVEMFQVSQLLTKEADPTVAGRPFDKRRDGFVNGEGAGFVVLETLEHAKARGARIYGEVFGYGAATAPNTAAGLGPSQKGFELSCAAAIADAGGIQPDAVFAHGLATVASDANETAALKTVLGARAATTPTPAIKSMLGNTFAASGGLETVAALQAIDAGMLPPTIHLAHADPACDLDYVAGQGRKVALSTVLLPNANLGGAHAALLVGKVRS
jgi:3-oxoacyl-[acyl-carrier-protein] synthase II